MIKRGFTLIELLIVIALVAILATLATVYAERLHDEARLSRVSSELYEIASSVNEYVQDNGGQYPADAARGVPPGLEKYLAGGTWPTSVWPQGVFDWDNWVDANNNQIYQISYRLCGTNDPDSDCSDPILFPTFVRDSAIFYCISGPCVPHIDDPTAPAYCVNCTVKKENYE